MKPDFWEAGHFRLFASHLSEQAEYATELKQSLLKYGISTFVAHRDIAPTRAWENEIMLALGTADALVALLHPGFHASPWTDQEVGFMLGRERIAVAVTFGEAPYGFIGRLQAFQGADKSTSVLAYEIFRAFAKNEQTMAAMTGPLVQRFEESNSFAQASNNLELLEQLDHWEPAFTDRITKALETNRQIEFSHGVPDRIQKLLAKWSEAAPK